jgi:hypothetical protein
MSTFPRGAEEAPPSLLVSMLISLSMICAGVASLGLTVHAMRRAKKEHNKFRWTLNDRILLVLAGLCMMVASVFMFVDSRKRDAHRRSQQERKELLQERIDSLKNQIDSMKARQRLERSAPPSERQ